jgi:hypothetical protein
MATPDEDRHITRRFYHGAILDQAATDAAGRRIYRDVEMFEGKFPGDPSRSIVAPAHDPCFMHRPKIGEDESVGFLTYAQRFAEDYKRFKATDPSAERSGTPLEHAPFLTQARVFELRAINIHTVETLAHLPGNVVQKHSLRPVVEQAKVWLGETEAAAAVAEANAKTQALEDRFAAMQAEIDRLRAGKPAGDDIDGWSDDRLREFLVGKDVTPRANASRDKLLAAVREISAMESAA